MSEFKLSKSETTKANKANQLHVLIETNKTKFAGLSAYTDRENYVACGSICDDFYTEQEKYKEQKVVSVQVNQRTFNLALVNDYFDYLYAIGTLQFNVRMVQQYRKCYTEKETFMAMTEKVFQELGEIKYIAQALTKDKEGNPKYTVEEILEKKQDAKDKRRARRSNQVKAETFSYFKDAEKIECSYFEVGHKGIMNAKRALLHAILEECGPQIVSETWRDQIASFDPAKLKDVKAS